MVGICTGIITTVAVAVGFYALFLAEEPKAPTLEDGWWGRGPAQPDVDKSIRNFKIQVPADVISDLKTRLTKTRLGEDLQNTQFHYGFQSAYLKEVIEYWKTKYDWAKHEAQLNTFQQFTTTIEGIEIHFLQVKPASAAGKKAARPILVTHGWPGSVWEFYKLIPRLTDPGKYGGRDEDAFEVICPSIPGFGFSEAPHQQGFDQAAAARIFNKLMLRLGHKKYYVQGGDWGTIISTVMAQAYPEQVLGAHLTMFTPAVGHLAPLLKQVVASFFPSLFLHPEEQKWWKPLGEAVKNTLLETGYFHLQATKPDTVAVGLNDSPAGLAAYILEKFSTLTLWDNRDLSDGGLTSKFTMDELLTNVMIYWVQGNIGSSMRFYKEFIRSDTMRAFDKVPVKVPTGLAAFPNEVIYEPEAFITGKFQNIVQFTRITRGGHFNALEEPELLANDVISFVAQVEKSKK